MKALLLHNDKVSYQTGVEVPKLTSLYNVLVKVYYAGICRTDIGIAKGVVPACEDVVLGHEFCGKIVGFFNGGDCMDGWKIGDVVSANPMAFGSAEEMMCGKDCDGAFADYIAVPSGALVGLSLHLLSPLGAYLEPIAAALAPFKYVGGRCCIYGGSRIAELTHQVARAIGHKNIEWITHLEELPKNSYDCIIETEPDGIDAYIDALKPGGVLVLKSRSFASSSFIANTIAMKEIRVQGARYGDFQVASHILSATASCHALNTDALFGNVYELSQFEAAFAEAEKPESRKTFFRICVE
jgi:threonine dehydrogenase-like Zn-dependent dehydrogenase